jgi:penicillin-binding protein 2
MVWQQEQRLSYENFLEKRQFVLFLFAGLFIFLILNLLRLQILRGNYYKQLSEKQKTHIVIEHAPRGEILDCRNEPLVSNKTAFVALFYPFSQNTTPPDELLDKLSYLFEDKKIAIKIIHGWKTGQIVRLAENLSREDMFKIQEQRLVLSGISVVEESRRDYHMAEANSHLIGYLNEVTKDELESLKHEGYKIGDWIGRRGLEKAYEGVLHGKDGGWEIEVDAQGRQTRLVRHVPPVIGNNIYTTIDGHLQQIAYDAIMKTPTQKGAVIGIDPRNGAIRILVSCPGYDPGLSLTREFGQYLVDDNLPLFNRAVQGLYPPGSIFKIVTFSGALNENIITPDKTFAPCTGAFTLGTKIFKCWDKKGHGILNLTDALAKSCDVYFYQLGLKIGEKVIVDYARKFRLDKPTGIELPSEKTGFVPSPEWKKEKLNQQWTAGDTVNMAIGQGSLWITPMQIAVMMSAVANRGTFYQPFIVDRIESQEEDVLYRSSVIKKGEVQLRPEVWDSLHEALKKVVREGTGQACKIKDFDVSGKTGTAQNPQGDDHAWFGAYAPSDNPELALVVLVEHGGHGAAVSVPIAKEIFKAAFPKETESDK